METQEYRADLKTLPESGPNPLPALSPGPGSVHLSAAISVQLCMAGNTPHEQFRLTRFATGPLPHEEYTGKAPMAARGRQTSTDWAVVRPVRWQSTNLSQI